MMVSLEWCSPRRMMRLQPLQTETLLDPRDADTAHSSASSDDAARAPCETKTLSRLKGQEAVWMAETHIQMPRYVPDCTTSFSGSVCGSSVTRRHATYCQSTGLPHIGEYGHRTRCFCAAVLESSEEYKCYMQEDTKHSDDTT